MDTTLSGLKNKTQNDETMVPIGQVLLNGYLEKLKQRPVTKKQFRTRLQELFDPYLAYIKWQNETIEDDMSLLFIKLSDFMKCHTDHDLLCLGNWIKDLNKLYPRQVIKTINTWIEKKNGNNRESKQTNFRRQEEASKKV